MNQLILVGRLSKNPEIRYTAGENSMAVATISLAVDRPMKKGGQKQTDFLMIKAFGKTAEVLEKYAGKGRQIAVVGAVHTEDYTNQEGKRVFKTELVADRVELLGTKADVQSEPKTESETQEQIPSGFSIDEDIPF